MGPCNKYDSLADLNPVQFEDLQIVRVGEHPYRVHVFKYFPIFKLALVSIASILLSFEDLQCWFEDFKNLKNPHYVNICDIFPYFLRSSKRLWCFSVDYFSLLDSGINCTNNCQRQGFRALPMAISLTHPINIPPPNSCNISPQKGVGLYSRQYGSSF